MKSFRGANTTSPTLAAVKFAYLDSEINGNDESKLVLFTYKNSSSTLSEQGRSSASTTDNWINLPALI
jgi:hypothetical protein